MISLSKGAMTIGAASMYFSNHLSVADYYAQDEAFTNGYLLGKGAEALGISGHQVTAEQFDRLLHGQHPLTGEALRAKAPPRLNADGKFQEERAGWDLTLSPPKSLTIQALAVGDARLIEADREAAIYAVGIAEKCALSRQRGGREWVQTANIVAVMFEHHEARESINGQHGPMPQLHHHTFIMNLTQRPDAKWRGLDPDQIYKSWDFIDAVYMARLARNVQQLGYGIKRRPDHRFELAGFTRQQIEAFSERAEDIKRERAELGITNGPLPQDVREQIILKTRKPKREYDPEELKQEHRALAIEQGIDLNYRPTVPVQTFAISPEEQAERSLRFGIAHSITNNAVPDFRDIVKTALKHGIGATDFDHLQAVIDVQQERGQLIAGSKSPWLPLGKYTTPEMVRLEHENLALVRSQMEHGRPIAGIAIRSAVTGQITSTGARAVREWATVRKLLPDQTDAAVFTLTSGHWATAIEGLAGTAKTSLVGGIKQFAEQHGWTVYGFGTTTGARDELEKVGLNARTIAALRAKPLPAKTSHELWVVDESSLLATIPLNELLKLAKQRGVERILFAGDQRQHLAIEAGAPVRQLLADHMAVAYLTKMRRQKEPGLLRVAETVAAGRTDEAIDLLIEQKRLVEIKEPAARYERIAAEYLNAHEAEQNCLVVSPANEERKAINQAVRAKLVEAGFVNTLHREHQILISREMTPPEKQHARSYREGEVIYFRRGSKARQIPKHAYLTIAAVNDDTLTLRAENGRLIEFDPSRWTGLNVYTPETRNIAVGDRLQWWEPDSKRGIANGRHAIITALDEQNIEVKFEHGRKVAMPLSEARVVDLGYASTSHKSQGSTVHTVIINVDSRRHVDLVNLRQFYVSETRAEWDARIYTDSIQGMRRAVSRKQEKELALDVVQKQEQTRSMGMRM